MSVHEPLDEYDDWLASNDWLEDTAIGDFPKAYESTTVDFDLSGATRENSLSYVGKDYDLLCSEEMDTGEKYFIQSVVGDDESNTTNSLIFALMIIIAGPLISGIKLSRKDCGCSRTIANFAEGWIITPPSSEASFEATNRRHANNGVPWVLDPPKLKYISPVRKQSSLELDLESKYVHLAKVASWTHKSWFTYHFHQMALLLANCIFDFVGGRTFPFLYKEEGGCGGMPPYQNLETGFSHLVRFNRGRSSRAILGIMDESVRIHQRQITPNQGLFVKASHFAQMGDKKWLAFTHSYQSLLKTNQVSRSQIRELMRGDVSSNLPSDILDLGVEIESTDPVMGAAISHLRKDGLLLTELDVKMILENRKRQEAIGGDVPLRQIIKEIDDETRLFKANHWKVLNLLSMRAEFQEFCTTVPLNIREESTMRDSPLWNILGEYYRLRSSTHDIFTSFQYSDTIKVFKRSEIEHLIRRTPSLLRADIAQGIDIPSIMRKFKSDIPQERERHKEVLEWLETKDLKSLLLSPLPPGVGPDDGRIFRSIMARLEEEETLSKHTIMLIIVSSDMQLCSRVFAYVKERIKDRILIFCNISARAYGRLCLGMLREENDRSSGNGFRNGPRPSRLTLYNYLKSEETPVPIGLERQIMALAEGRQAKVLVEFDYPNVERYLENTRYESSTNTVVELNGGFLDRRTLDSLPTHYCWSALPVSKIAGWTDFDKNSVKKFPLGKLFSDNIVLFRPFRDALTNIDNWRTSVASLSGS